MEGIETKESSTGAKLLSAFPRVWIRSYQAGVRLPPGLQQLITDGGAAVPGFLVALVKPAGGNPKLWPVTRNLRYRFAGNSLTDVESGSGSMAVESAGMQIAVGTIAAPGSLGIWANAARLSSLTALLLNQNVSFDEWEIDCNDLLSAFPTAQCFNLYLQFVINNTDVNDHKVDLTSNLIAEAALFDSYRFSKWE